MPTVRPLLPREQANPIVPDLYNLIHELPKKKERKKHVNEWRKKKKKKKKKKMFKKGEKKKKKKKKTEKKNRKKKWEENRICFTQAKHQIKLTTHQKSLLQNQIF